MAQAMELLCEGEYNLIHFSGDDSRLWSDETYLHMKTDDGEDAKSFFRRESMRVLGISPVRVYILRWKIRCPDHPADVEEVCILSEN